MSSLGHRRSHSSPLGRLGLATAAVTATLASGCQTPIDTTRVSAYTGTLGEEIHRVFCQRFSSEAYPTDVTGGLTAALCRGTETPTAETPVHLRELVEQRDRIVPALDATMPEDTHTDLFDLLRAMLPLYDDGTMQASTRTLATVLDTLSKDQESVDAFARFSHREGYRPMQFGLGIARPALRYSGIREVITSSLGALGSGGVAEAPFHELLRGGALEMATYTPATGADLPSNVTLSRQLLLQENAAFASGTARWSVVRDTRGMAMPTGVTGTGTVPAPFVDANGDHLPDVDSVGRFVGAGGTPLTVAPPFAIDGETGVTRDAQGRATANGGGLVWQYRDLDRTMAAGFVREMASWVDPAAPTLVRAARGLPVMMGTAGDRTRTFGMTTLTYPGFDPATGPVYDLLHAVFSFVHRQETVDGLRVVEDMMTNHEAQAADLVQAGLYGDQRADAHPEAALQQPNIFWDDLLYAVERMAQTPGMLEGVTRALDSDAVQDLDEVVAIFARNRDAISFNPASFNDPLPANASWSPTISNPVNRASTDADPANESLLQRSVYLIHDLDGVQYCNKQGAHLIIKVGGNDIDLNNLANVGALAPLVQGIITLAFGEGIPASYNACDLFQIDNVAKAYTQTIWGGFKFELKGVPGKLLGAASTLNQIGALFGNPNLGNQIGNKLLEDTTGITGMGTYPTPQAMARFVFAPRNANLQALVDDLLTRDGVPVEDRHCIGRAAGNRTTPCPSAIIFAWEKPVTLKDGRTRTFLEALRPLLQAMDTAEGPADQTKFFFGAISTALHTHWPSRSATRTQRTNASSPAFAYQDNIRSYEPLVAEIFDGGLLLHRLRGAVQVADAFTVRTGYDGVQALAALLQVVLDPTRNCVGSCTTGSLKYRNGTSYITYNNGTRMDGQGGRPRRYPSPMYLLLDALGSVDDAWVGQDTRHTSWLQARSSLVDQFFTTEVVSMNRRFKNRRGHNILLLTLPFLRGRVEAHRTGANPTAQDTTARNWATAREASITDTLSGPVVAGVVRLLDSIDQDATARDSLLGLLQALMNEQQNPEGVSAMLYALSDALQLLDDDASVIPIVNTLSVALAANAQTVVTAGGSVSSDDATAARTVDLLQKTSALDTNGVLSRVLANAASQPATGNPITQIETLMDAIAEVNRATPGAGGPVDQTDVLAILDVVYEFLTNSDRGLERLYAVIENRRVK